MLVDSPSRRDFIKGTTASSLMAAIGAGLWQQAEANASPLSEYEQYDAMELARLVRNGEVTPTELLDAAINRVEVLNGELNAVVTPMFEEARQSIRRGLPDGPFRGVPFLLKDIAAQYKGVRYTAGSKALADYKATEDSELVKRYKKAGLVIFGRTNTPEFGINVTTESRLFGPACNPWNTAYSTGGSSGGAAAAVAARMVPMAQGGDGGGSIRIPASCCGVFGMKPSRGRMPMGPISGEVWEGFVTHHTLSMTVRDNAAILDATAVPEVGEPYGIRAPRRPFLQEVAEDPKPLRIAWTINGGAQSIDPDCVEAVNSAATLCDGLGHNVEEAAPDIDYDLLWPAFFLVVEAHTAAALDGVATLIGKEVGPDSVEPWTWRVAQRGNTASAADLAKAKGQFNRATRALGKFFTKYDLLLTPTLGTPPKKLGSFDTLQLTYEELNQRMFDFIPYTWIHNVTGTPAMSVPLYWNDAGLPIGVQFATRLADEAILFQLAGQLERANGWRDRRPIIARS